ncbi:MAG TPA: hypothetical protein VF176_05945 [Solirubrobacterales bacterium]
MIRKAKKALRHSRAPVILAALLSALCLVPASALADGEFEPNDSEETAYGPLVAGAVYSATLENGDDIDSFFFYVGGDRETPVQVTITDTTSDGDGLYAELSDSEDVIDDLDVPGGDFDVFEEDLAPGTYYLDLQTELFEQTNETYEIRVEGGTGAFLTDSQIQAQCNASNAEVAKATAALLRAQKRLRHVRKGGSAHQKAVARRAVKRAKARLGEARAAAAQACSISSG